MTNREVISKITNSLRAVNKDDRIPQRYILSTAKTKARSAMANRIHFTDLIGIESLYRTISCMKMIPDDVVRCNVVEFRRCEKLMRSAKKLPELFDGKYGALIIMVTTVDGLIKFKPTNPKRYLMRKNRINAGNFKENFYYIHNGYLYLPDSEYEAISLVVIGFDDDEIAELSDCGDKDKTKGCKSELDKDFICPDKLLDLVISSALQEILGSWRQITPDENPNSDANIRSSTTN